MEISSDGSGLGKSELALSLALLAQKSGRPAVYFDYGGNLNTHQIVSRAKSWGMEPDGLIVLKPAPFYDILDAAPDLGEVPLIVVDDLAAVTTQDLEDSTAPRRCIRTLLTNCPNASIVVTNQTRFLGARTGTYLDDFMSRVCQVRLLLSPAGILRDQASQIGHRLKVTAHYPSSRCEDRVFKLFHTYRDGIDPVMNSLATGVKAGVVDLKGTHLSYGGVNLGQGLLLASREVERQNLKGKLLEVEWHTLRDHTTTLQQ